MASDTRRNWRRYETAVRMRREGATLKEVAVAMGVTKERARQMEATAIRCMATGKALADMMPLTPREQVIFERYSR